MYCFGAEFHGLIHILSFNGQGRVEVDDVSHGAENQSQVHGFSEDVPADTFGGIEGFLCRPVFHQFDGVDETNVADFAYVLMMAQGFHEFFVEIFPVFIYLFQDVVPFHDFQHGQGDGAAHGISCIGMAVDEGFVGAVVVVEGVVHLVGGNGDGHGHVAGGEAFGGAENIRGNAGVFNGKEGACASEACSDFIVDEEDAVFIAEFPELPEVFRRIDTHAGSALEDRLHNAGHRFFSVFLEGFFGAFKAFHMAGFPGLAVGTAVAVQAFEMDVVHEHGVEYLGVKIHGAHGQGADGFTVIGFGEAHEAGPFRMAGLVLVLEGHFQGRFHRGGAVVVEGKLGEALRQKRFQLPAQFDGRFMGEIGENHVLQLIHLLLQGLIDFRIAVAQKVAPPRRNNVQVFLAMGVVQVYPLAVVYHHRWKYFVILHLHGRMPDVFLVFRFPVNICHFVYSFSSIIFICLDLLLFHFP